MPTPTFCSRTETLENRDFSVYLLSISPHRYALRLPQGPIRRKPDRCGLQAARKLLNTLTAQYGEPTTYPALKTASPRTSTA